MATSADISEGPIMNGVSITRTVAASTAITAGQCVKLDSSGNLVLTSANTDPVIGAAAESAPSIATATQQIKVIVIGRVKTGSTLTAGSKVEPDGSGGWQNYTSGTCVGICTKAATTASEIILSAAR